MTEAVEVASAPPLRPARDWRVYNLGHTTEMRLFDGLLWGLLQAIEEPAYKGNGRPPLPLREVLFCAVKKAHTGFSSRRNQGIIEDAADEGLLSRAPHFNAASKQMNRAETEAVLRRLVQLSAIPLAGIERDFAIDSTGFATGTYGSYRTLRYGETQKQKWVKLHVCVGVVSNVITDAIVTDGNAGDSPRFEPLIRKTAEAFDIDDVTADKAYSSKANRWVVHQLGGDAVIPFLGGRNEPSMTMGSGRSSAAGAPGKPGSAKLWRRAYHYFKLHEDEFYARYHKRSNVEATFSAMKHRMVERLKAKSLQAQKAEVLCKAVAWNIGVLVRAMHEFGVEPEFPAPKPGGGLGV